MPTGKLDLIRQLRKRLEIYHRVFWSDVEDLKNERKLANEEKIGS